MQAAKPSAHIPAESSEFTDLFIDEGVKNEYKSVMTGHVRV